MKPERIYTPRASIPKYLVKIFEQFRCDRRKVRPIMVRRTPTWGWTYRKAGFIEAGETKGGLLAKRMMPVDMPSPREPLPRSMWGTPLFDRMCADENLAALC